MAYNSAAGLGGMLKAGTRHFSQDDDSGASGSVVLRNIEACLQLSRMLSTSMGPQGRCKLVVNHLGKLSVTSDCASVLSNVEVEHPAAQLLSNACAKQEEECGDNTNVVLAVAGELLWQTALLIGKMTWQPAPEIIAGFQRAWKLCRDVYLPQLVVTIPINTNDSLEKQQREWLLTILRPVLASKQYGSEGSLAPLVADACLSVMTSAAATGTTGSGGDADTTTLNASPLQKMALKVEAVRTVKILGACVSQSSLVAGYVALRPVETVCTRVIDNSTNNNPEFCKIAVFACGLEASSTEAKGTVVMKTAEDLLQYNKSEEAKMKELIAGIVESNNNGDNGNSDNKVGVNVLVTGGNVSDMALHCIESYKNVLLLKIGSKWELRRLCQAVGATALVRVGPPTPEELGHAQSVQQVEVGGKPVTIFQTGNNTLGSNTNKNNNNSTTSTPEEQIHKQQQQQQQKLATIVLRASTATVLADLERAVDDGVQAVAQALRDPRVVYGGGAVEMALSTMLQTEAASTPGLEQYAFAALAKALQIVPRTLAENAGSDPTRVLANLQAAHAAKTKQNTNGDDDNAGVVDVGVDINVTNGTTSMKDKQVYDLLSTKISALNLAMDAVTTILKIDQIIMSKPAGAGGVGGN